MFGPNDAHAKLSHTLQSSEHVSNPTQQARKRKYDDISNHIHFHTPFTIEAHSSPTIQEPLRLLPKILIPRSCLPIAFFDFTGGKGNSRSNRFFSARVPVLEQELSPAQALVQQIVLIAASCPNDCLYAVERVRRGAYALCRLAAWVSLKELERSRLEYQPHPKSISIERDPFSDTEWWHALAIKSDIGSRCIQPGKSKPVDLVRPRICMKPPAVLPPQSPSIEEVQEPVVPNDAPVALSEIQDEAPPELPRQDPDETLRMVRAQYQEALYASQASLAYFAKGTLSRARALFNTNDVVSSDGLSLAEYLRICILSLPTMDKKYKETLPNFVKELPIGVFSDDENITAAFRKKTRKKNSSKIGKDGLYPEEEVSVIRWWLGRRNSIDGDDSSENRDERVRLRMAEQRARETQLQIILLLETLALEASHPGKTSENDPIVVGEKHPSSKKQKTKKLQDLNVLLDLQIDRLCIWQSMSVGESGSSTHEDKTVPRATLIVSNEGRKFDILRDFCVDVILPFYSARLPTLSAKVCQKLGGPKSPSPSRPPLRRAATSSEITQRPGAEIRRPAQLRQPRRTLERVLTEQRLRDQRSGSRKPAPSLSRSTTEPVLPRLKRECSEISVSPISLYNVALPKARRYSQREVDLGTVSQSNESKLKRKVQMEKELQGAIAALKRPNPRMAVKELVEDAEKRTTGSSLRKKKKPVRNPTAQRVQVMATPRGNRQKDVYGGLPSIAPQSQQGPPLLPEINEIPPSSALRAISSTPRSCVPKSRPAAATIDQTPTRAGSKLASSSRLLDVSSSSADHHHQIEQPGLPSSPMISLLKPKYALNSSSSSSSSSSYTTMMKSSSSKFSTSSLETPSKPRQIMLGQEIIKSTPITKRLQKNNNNTTPLSPIENPECSPSGGTKSEISIYKTLGWDDDIDDLL